MNLIAQAIIAYLGLLPPLYALLDLLILQDIKTEILLDFMVYYTLIIFVILILFIILFITIILFKSIIPLYVLPLSVMIRDKLN